VFFRVLKSGCRVEERRFEHIDHLLTCLAVYLIVSWRTLYTCRLGQSCPDINCEAVFDPAEWKAVWKVLKRTDPPANPPKLGELVRLVAQLGGYVNRKRRDPQGRKRSGWGCNACMTWLSAGNCSAPRPTMAVNLCRTTRVKPRYWLPSLRDFNSAPPIIAQSFTHGIGSVF
jgi:hypothetical protein